MIDLPVKLIRRRGQKTIRIRVKNGNIFVSAPYQSSRKEIERFVNSQSNWINKQVNKHNELLEQVNSEVELGKWLVDGKWIPFEAFPDNKKSVSYSGEKITFYHTTGITELERQDLSQQFQSWAKQILKNRFWKVAEEIGLKPVKVSIRSQQSKWGSCSGKKTISLNWRLIKCPPEIQRYIFIHELCHLEQMNHSSEFWKLVDHYYPDRKKAESWLRKNSRAMFLD